MKRLALTTALTLALTAPAFANDQLANGLGIDADAYSTSDIIALNAAIADDNHATANAIRKNDGRLDTAATERSVEQAIASALASNDYASARAIRAAADGVTVSSKSFGTSGGHRQLAASLGVDAGDYTVAELVHLKSLKESDNGRGD